MSEEFLDEDVYPTDEALNRIVEWPHTDMAGLLAFVEPMWRYPDRWTREGDRLIVSTGGWSGNEDLMRAMQQNRAFWAICWFSSQRGGHFIFDLSRVKDLEKKQ